MLFFAVFVEWKIVSRNAGQSSGRLLGSQTSRFGSRAVVLCTMRSYILADCSSISSLGQMPLLPCGPGQYRYLRDGDSGRVRPELSTYMSRLDSYSSDELYILDIVCIVPSMEEVMVELRACLWLIQPLRVFHYLFFHFPLKKLELPSQSHRQRIHHKMPLHDQTSR